MRYLGLALFAEGPSDHRFLSPLLFRACEAECLAKGLGTVEIGPIVELHSPQDLRNKSRKRRICEAATRSAASWNILFVHTDGGGQPNQANRQRIEPAVRQLRDELLDDHDCVAIVPVRETEAWVLADPEGMLRAFGFARWGATVDPIVGGGDVEGVMDPKRILRMMFRSVARKGSVDSFYERLGEMVSLQRLRSVPAYAAFEGSLHDALNRLRFTGD